MLYVILSFSIIFACAFFIMIFALLRVSRRADEAEDKILDIILPSQQPSFIIKKEEIDGNIEEGIESPQESEVQHINKNVG